MRIFWVYLLYGFLACAAMGQSVSTPPARMVKSYALTSVLDLCYERDPSAWQLLASNDGKNWTVLDVRTNHPAAVPGQRRVFYIQNETAYRLYRLQVDENVTRASRQVGLAEFELLGPVAGVTNEVDLQAIITSSQEHPLMGAAVNAFDGDVGTKWIDFAPFSGGGCWIQCEYVRQSEVLISNINQVHVFTHLAATSALLTEKAQQILSHLAAKGSQTQRTLTGYALTSANDYPERDPRDWKLLGSNDGGESWNVVDVRRNEIFSSRLGRRVFWLSEPAKYETYRLEINSRQLCNSLQIAEIEPLYSDKAEGGGFSLAILASSENAPMEKTEMAFDGDTRSKWLGYVDGADQFAWVQWRSLPEVEGLRLINLRQFGRLVNRNRTTTEVPKPGNLTRTLTSYSLTSANDEPNRDPRDWVLLGSNNGGTTWETLDERRNEFFKDRFQKRLFTVTNPAPYALYRLQINSVPDPTNGNFIQLAEIEPAYAPEATRREFSIVVAARADNDPWEKADRAFDGDPRTKWLDPSLHGERTSWVQWYFANREKLAVIRADSGSGIQPGLPRVMNLQLEGVAVSASSNSLGVLDKNGFQMFKMESSSTVAPGSLVRLTGRLQFGNGFPKVKSSQLAIMGSLKDVGSIGSGQLFGEQRGFVFGSVEGKVTAVSEGPSYTSVQLTTEGGTRTLMARILNPECVPFPILTDCQLRVRGVIEPTFDESGEQYPGIIWVDGRGGASFISAAAQAMAKSSPSAASFDATNELSSIRQIKEALEYQPNKVFNVRIRGVITYIDLGLVGWYLQDGPSGIYVQEQFSAGLSPFMQQEGMYVELKGTAGVTNNEVLISPAGFVKVLGKGRMPSPLRHSLEYLMTGNDDSKWVQLDGIVAEVEKQKLILDVEGERLAVWVNEMNQSTQNRLLGSLVRVSGVCSPVFNNRRQRLGIRLLVPSAEHVEMINASPENPFDLQTRPISSLMQSGLGQTASSPQLVKITGVVTYKEPRLLFVQDATNGLRVLTRTDASVKPGDIVEVVGLAEMDGLSPKLGQALVKKTGKGPLPVAHPIDLGIDSVKEQASRDATRGSVEATLLGHSYNESAQVLQLKQEKTEKTFLAYLPLKTDILTSVPKGSRVRIEGAFKAKTDSVPDFGQVTTSFEMFLNSPADIEMLERPPWWTVQRTLWVLGGLGVVLLVALAWAGLERKTNQELEQRVKERTAKLHEAVGELEHFSYTITHDMRAPLRAMRGYGDILLEENADLADESKQYITRITSAAGRMDNLITDALHYSKLVRHEFNLSPIDCEALLHDMIHSYPQYQESKSGICIEGKIPMVQGNEAALTQCFSNLLNNAIKFVAPGKKPEIRIRAEDKGQHVRIWFQDNGIGIPKDCHERIFVMFQRINPTYEGTGIGLALVRKAAERMGGKVGLESEPGKGSKFWVEINKAR